MSQRASGRYGVGEWKMLPFSFKKPLRTARPFGILGRQVALGAEGG